MRRKLLATTIAIISAIVSTPAEALIPLPNAAGEYTYDESGNLTIAGNFSLGDLRPFTTSGSYQADSQTKQILGYDPSRSWNVGDFPVEVIKFGDLKTYGLQKMSLAQINQGNTASISLNQLGLLKGQSLKDLTKAIPNLGDRRIKEIAPLKDLLPKRLHNRQLEDILDRTPYDLSQEIEKEVNDEVKQYIQQQINHNQVQIVTGISEGIKLTSKSITEEINLIFPDAIPLELGTVDAAIEQAINEGVNKATAELEQKVSRFIESNYDRASREIDIYINNQIQEYQIEIERVIAVTTTKYETAVKEQILAQGDIALEKLNLDGFTRKFDEYKNIVNDYARESTAIATKSIDSYVSQKFGNISSISEQIPDNIGEIKLGDYDLSKYSLEDLPNLKNTPIEKFKNYQNADITDVPGAAELDVNRYPTMPNFGGGIALVDLVFSEAEKFADRAISGSIRETFNLATCSQGESLNGGCAHIELGGPSPFNRGKQWVSGDSQEVKGGKNLLKDYKGGKEPTGRLPAYKSPFKMVLRNNDEATDTADLYLALQICVTDITGTEHCTPHNVMEFPVYTFGVGDLIFLGVTI